MSFACICYLPHLIKTHWICYTSHVSHIWLLDLANEAHAGQQVGQAWRTQIHADCHHCSQARSICSHHYSSKTEPRSFLLQCIDLTKYAFGFIPLRITFVLPQQQLQFIHKSAHALSIWPSSYAMSSTNSLQQCWADRQLFSSFFDW